LSLTMNRIWRTGLWAAVLCGVVACTRGPHKTDAQRQLDREMADSVQAALNADKLLYSRHITVRADGGVVNLSGYVWSRDDLDEAKRVASAVPGVTNVVNDMELERNGVDDSPVSR
jgi:osmotically-inducible protein OsmY